MTTKPSSEHCLPHQVDAWLRTRRQDAAFKRATAEFLCALVEIDTTPRPRIAEAALASGRVFAVIEHRLRASVPGLVVKALNIREEIADHPYFTLPYYAGDVSGSKRQLVRRVYAGRGNLFLRLPNPGKSVLAFNAHVDTVAPHIPGRIEGDIVHGRGACDDKGPCLAAILALEYLAAIRGQFGIEPACEVLTQFVIDEETGGNGSLSAALEKEQGRFDAIVVLECTDLGIHPGNRGVVWYETQLATQGTPPSDTDVLLEAMAFVIEKLGQCGDQLKAESDHPLFPHRPVQTNHGRLAHFGEHPSRVQDHVALELRWQGWRTEDIHRLVDEALAAYCQRYGDKTKPGTGAATLDRHIAWTEANDRRATLEVFGIAGHMGAVDRLDGAITKAAAIIRRLVHANQETATSKGSLSIALADRAQLWSLNPLLSHFPTFPPSHSSTNLTMEGGQGFLPTHELEDVAERMRRAANAGVAEYLSVRGLSAGSITCATTFEKLHNAAFARPADGPAMTALLAGARESGLYDGQPVRGWDVSCDARIFAREFPDAEVLTFGPGHLAQAHANTEHIDVNEILLVAEALTRMALRFGGRRGA